MEQLKLVQDVTPAYFEAAKRDVKALGNYKAAAKLIYPDDADPEKAGQKVSNLFNGNPGCRPLTPEQWHAFKEGVCLKNGRSYLVEYELSKLPIKFKWVPRERYIQRAESRLETLLQEMQGTVEEIRKWRLK